MFPLYEYTWNHTTMWALKTDKAVTYLQTLFPAGQNIELVERMNAHFGDEVMHHLEFVRAGGGFTCFGIQLVRYTTDERLDEIMAIQAFLHARLNLAADPLKPYKAMMALDLPGYFQE